MLERADRAKLAFLNASQCLDRPGHCFLRGDSVFFSGVIYHGVSIKGLGVMDLVLGLSGVVAFARLQKLTRDLKARSVLDAYFKEEQSHV